jgi:hypothetical protein
VGGCCGRPESAAADDADVLGSAAPIVALGGCWPVVALAPAVGPAPASFDASNLVTLSISVVHGPAPAVPADNAARAQAPSSNVIVFMALSPVAMRNAAHADFVVSISTGNASRRSVPPDEGRIGGVRHVPLRMASPAAEALRC